MPNRDDYFLTAADLDDLLGAVPATFEGNSRITSLIGPADYYTDLRDSLNRLGTSSNPEENSGQFIFINNWTLGLGDNGSAGAFSLDGINEPTLLRDVLVEKAQRGVDVRVMGWVSLCVLNDPIVQAFASNVVGWNLQTLESIRLLRQQSNNQIKACINVLNHARGSVHTKLVVMSDASGELAVGYTGGLDFVSSRHGWHDVVAKVEGPALNGLYEFYRQMWNELVTACVQIDYHDGTESIESVVSGTPTIVDHTSLSLVPAVEAHSVQSLRTVSLEHIHHTNYQLSFAPNGLFEVRAAWQKAIQAATHYIYMEDQYFWSTDVMDWIRETVINHTDVVVILVCHNRHSTRHEAYSHRAIQDHLLDDLNSGQRSRISLFRRTDRLVHSKTTLIDDCWAIIGSANCNNRGLYTDIEHSVSMFHEDFVRDYRTRLWSFHFQGNREVSDCDQALHVWNSDWGSSGSGTSLLPEIEPWPLAVGPGIIDEICRRNIEDPDSRDINGCFSFVSLISEEIF